MLRALLRKADLQMDTRPQPWAQPLPETVAINGRPAPPPYTPAASGVRKRRQNRPRVCHLYAKPPQPALIHARALLAFILEGCPDYGGGYVPQSELDRYYRTDVCKLKSWAPLHWTSVARQLGKLTQKKIMREGNNRFTAYRIPRT